MGKDKIAWVNRLRGLAILAVVLGHINTPLTPFIFSWHMPFFFFLSGFLLSRRNLTESIKLDFRRLIIPYFVFGFLAILAEYLKRNFWPGFDYIHSSFSFKEEFISLFLWMDAGKIHTYGFILWFLPALFWSKNIVILLYKIFRSNWIILVIGLLLWFLVINQKEIWWFGLDKAMISIVWIALGKLVRVNIHKILRSWLVILLGLFLFLEPIPVLNMAYKIALDPIVGLIYPMAMILLLIYFFRKVQIGLLSSLGMNSMLIFALHPYTNNLAYIIIGKYWFIEFIVSLICLFVVLWFRNVIKKTRYANLVNWI